MVEVAKTIEALEYKEEEDFKPLKDEHGPASYQTNPNNRYLKIPDSVEVMFIDTEDKIKNLEKLVGQDIIGVDSEWRTKINQGHDVSGTTILQLAGENQAFIIDLPALVNSKPLDEMLTKIFSNEKTIIVGCGFKSDIGQFQADLSSMSFYKNIPNFLDIQTYYNAV